MVTLKQAQRRHYARLAAETIDRNRLTIDPQERKAVILEILRQMFGR